MNDVPLYRLYLLRALYLLIVVGLGSLVWPGVVLRDEPWPLWQGITTAMLAAFSALSVLGLRYPLQMLPLLLWEMAWKTIWLLSVALPLWRAGRMDESTWAITSQCLWVVVIPFVVPWGYLRDHYLRKQGDRWHAAQAR